MDLIHAKTEISKDFSDVSLKKARKLGYILSFICFILGILLAYISYEAIVGSIWLAFFIVSVFSISIFAVSQILNPTVKTRMLASFLFTLPMYFFSFSFLGYFAIFLGTILIILSIERMYAFLKNVINIYISQVIGVGIGAVLLSLSLVVAGQYICINENKDVKEIIPKLSNVFGVDKIIDEYVVGSKHGGIMTVDGFIIKMVESNNNAFLGSNVVLDSLDIGKNVKEDLKNALKGVTDSTKEYSINSVRENFSDSVGMNLTGKENIVSVIMSLIQNQFERIILSNPTISSFFVEILALILFVLLSTMFSVLRYPVIWVSNGIFNFLIWLGIFKIVKINSEVDYLICTKL